MPSASEKTAISIKEFLQRVQQTAVDYNNYSVNCENQKDARAAMLWAVQNKDTQLLNLLFNSGISLRQQDDELLKAFVTGLESSASKPGNQDDLQEKLVNTLLLLLKHGLDVAHCGRSLVQRLFSINPLDQLLEKLKRQQLPQDVVRQIAKIFLLKGARFKDEYIALLDLSSDIQEYCRATQDIFQDSTDWAIVNQRLMMFNEVKSIFDDVVIDAALLQRVINSTVNPDNELRHAEFFMGLLNQFIESQLQTLVSDPEQTRQQILDSWFSIACQEKLYCLAFALVAQGANIYTPFDQQHQTLVLVLVDQVIRGDQAALAKIIQEKARFDLNTRVNTSEPNSEMTLLAAIADKGVEDTEQQTTVTKIIQTIMLPSFSMTTVSHRLMLTQDTICETLKIAVSRNNLKLIIYLMINFVTTAQEKLKCQRLLLTEAPRYCRYDIIAWLCNIQDCLLESATIVQALQRVISARNIVGEHATYLKTVIMLLELYKLRQQSVQQASNVSSLEQQSLLSVANHSALAPLLLIAAQERKIKTLGLLIRNGADINYAAPGSESLLLQLAKSAMTLNNKECRKRIEWVIKELHTNINFLLQVLLKGGDFTQDLQKSDSTLSCIIKSFNDQLTKHTLELVLIFAAKHGFLETFRQVFNIFYKFLDVKARYGESQITLLMLVAQLGHADVLNNRIFLYVDEDNINAQDKDGMTALMYATKNTSKNTSKNYPLCVKMVDFFIKRSRTILNMVDYQQRTALMHAIAAGNSELAYDFVVKYNAGLHFRDNKGHSVLTYLARLPITENTAVNVTATPEYKLAVAVILRSGNFLLELEHSKEIRTSPLLRAAYDNHKMFIELMQLDHDGQTELMRLVQHRKSVELITQHLSSIPEEIRQAYVNHQDRHGKTALCYVEGDVVVDISKLMSCLIDYGADVHVAIENLDSKVKQHTDTRTSRGVNQLWMLHERLRILESNIGHNHGAQENPPLTTLNKRLC